MNHPLQSATLSAPATTAANTSTLSFQLLMVVYAFLAPLGTLPVLIGERTYSVEFLFSLLCVLVVALELAAGNLKVAKCNGRFLFGLALWLAANLVSMLFHFSNDLPMMLFRMVLKALFGYMVFLVLMNNGRLGVMLKAYVAGCAIAGLFTIAFFVQGGDLETLRQASFAGLNASALDINVFRGIARAGASNLLPLWICIVLYSNTRDHLTRSVHLFLIPYFALLSTLALRREVLIEGAVGLLVLLVVFPARRRLAAVSMVAVIACIAFAVVSHSERWLERLNFETRDQFETSTDPRVVLLMNTPQEVLNAPLLGQGPGAYRWTMSKYFPTVTDVTLNGVSPHNSFSRAAVETGIFGLLGFLVMTAALGWRACLHRSRNAPVNGLLRLAAILIFLQVGGWLFFGDGITNNITWYFIGVLLYLDRRLFREDNRIMAPA